LLSDYLPRRLVAFFLGFLGSRDEKRQRTLNNKDGKKV